MRGRAGSIAALAIGSALIATGSAQGALTTAVQGDTVRVFSDTPGEQNVVFMAIDDDDGLIVDDDAGVAAGDCPISGGNRILLGDCLGPGTDRLRFEFGGGNDQLAATDPRMLLFNIVFERVSLSGGSGNDDLVALFANETQLGPGDDHAQGFFGATRVSGGGGDDLIEGGGSSDTLRGGPGKDRLYGGWRAPDDGFSPGDGRDRLVGGGGADRLFAKDFTKDKRLDCGPGNDRLKRDRFDPRPRSC